MVLYIVIPVHNRKEFTRDCLKSLNEQSLTGHKVVVVDDGSTDGTREMIEVEFPETIVLRGDGNLFWTAAINMGIRYALDDGADYIMTLNNDTIATPDFIERMIYWAKINPDVLLGAFNIDFVTKRPYYGGEILNWPLAKSRFLLDILPSEEWKGLHRVSLFPGRGLLIPRKVFESIGLFDQRKLPHYMADYDFTLMAARNGFDIYCNYDARLYTYPEEGGDSKIRKKKSLNAFFAHLFSIKGGGNLKNYTIYTIRNCPRHVLIISLFTGYFRRIVGFWMK